jgi:restriction system protein
MLGADAVECSLANGQGRDSHNAWNRQEALRLQRQNAAAEKAAERERKLQETAAGKAQAEQLNADLEARVARLESILRRGLDREAAIDLNAMLRTDEVPPLDLGTDGVAAPRPIWSSYAPPEPGPIAGFFGAKSRHEQRLAEAREKFERAQLAYEQAEVARQERIRERTSRYEAALLAYQHDIARHNTRIAQISAGVRERDRESVQYLELVLAATLLPDDVPHTAEVAYSPRGEQAVVRFELPSIDVIPGVESYTYVGTTATLRKKERPAAKIAQLYRSVIGHITLLYMRNIFDSDPETG